MRKLDPAAFGRTFGAMRWTARCYTLHDFLSLRLLAMGALVAWLPGPGVRAAPPETFPSEGPLHAVVEHLFGETVLPYAGEQLEGFEAALGECLRALNEEGVESRRVNEVGHAVEAFVLEALREAGFEVDRPATRSGRQRAAGYPDLAARRGEDAFYLEIKTYHPDTAHSSQRTFYLSPSEDPKVTRPAFHLLVAFAMVPDAEGRYRAVSAQLVDLRDLPVSLKLEYNASNRELYAKPASLLHLQAADPAASDITPSHPSGTRR
jgi:hypothetical protein